MPKSTDDIRHTVVLVRTTLLVLLFRQRAFLGLHLVGVGIGLHFVTVHAPNIAQLGHELSTCFYLTATHTRLAHETRVSHAGPGG